MIKALLVGFFVLCPTMIFAQCGSGQVIYEGPIYHSRIYSPPIIYSEPIYRSPPIVYSEPIYRSSVYSEPSIRRVYEPVYRVAREPVVELYLGTMREETRVYEWVRYDSDQYRRVPVINGIVPAIRRYEDSSKITFRYDLGEPIEKCNVYGKNKEEIKEEPRYGGAPTPSFVPSPNTDLNQSSDFQDVNPQDQQRRIEPERTILELPDGTKRPLDVDGLKRVIPPSYDR